MIRQTFRRIKNWLKYGSKKSPRKLSATKTPGYDPFHKPRSKAQTPQHVSDRLRHKRNKRSRNRRRNKIAYQSRRMNRLRAT